MAIGSSKYAFSIGEVAFYSHYIEKIPHRKIDKGVGFICTCKKQISECSFWKEVQKKVGINNAIVKDRGYIETFKIFFNLLMPSEKTLFPLKNISKNKIVLDAIYKNSRKLKPKLKMLVDSSKDPRRLFDLLIDKDIKKENIYVIYLLRDGRSYLNSYKKDVIKISGVNKRNILITMAEWIGVHIASRRIIKKYKLKHRVVRYQDFVENPDAFLKNIFGFLNLEEDFHTDKVLKEINRGTYHNLHGNFVKFEPFERIFNDTSWRLDLNLFEKAISGAFLF